MEKETEKNKEIKGESLDLSNINSKRYFSAIGRRKTSVARVRLQTKGEAKGIVVNERNYKEYFFSPDLQRVIESPLESIKALDKFYVSVKVKGGGISSQSEAIRHGIARALVEIDGALRKKLRRMGYLTRDPRMRERKKFGLKRARKAPQWAKR